MAHGEWRILLLVLLLTSIAGVPLLRTDSPCTHDSAFHYYRVVAMRHMLQDGLLFTRYLPDLTFGYGYPFFNYRAPLSYYLALGLYLLGLSLPAALNSVYVLSLAASAVAAYLLARDLFGPPAGIVAAVAYAYAPYQFLDALLRANMPESVALPLLPLTLWTFRRLALTERRRYFIAAVLSLVTLNLTHNISNLLFTPLLLAYLAFLWLTGEITPRKARTVAAAFLIAWGLSAFFWAPALLEQNYAQLHMSHTTRNNDFHYNFLPLTEILAPPAPVDLSLMNPPMQIHLGLPLTILALAGLLLGLRHKDKTHRLNTLFFALTAALFIWMSTPASLWLWEHLPLLPFVQFPWRFIGRAALPIALLAAVPCAVFPPRACVPASCLLIILTALPATWPPYGYCPQHPHPDITAVFAYEHQSKLVGVDPEGSYFPVWVERRPTGSPLEAQYTSGEDIARFDPTAIPAGATIVEADYAPNRARVVVTSPTAFTARYLVFYFPGWRVEIDGHPVPIAPTNPDGLLSFDVPAGRHTLTIRFGETPLRRAADLVSLASLVALAGVLLSTRNTKTPSRPRTDLHPTALLTLALGALALLAFRGLIAERTATPFRRPLLRPDGKLPGIEHPLERRFADGLFLLGYDLKQTALPADGELHLTLYWTAYARPTARYQTVLHLVGDDGLRWSQSDTARPRGYADYPPTDTWDGSRYARDSHIVIPLTGAPPGAYHLVLSVFDRATLTPLSVLNDAGQPAAPDLSLDRITLTIPTAPVAPPLRRPLDIPLDDITLLEARLDRNEAAPGDPVLLTTFWRAERHPTDDITFTLAFISPDGSPAAEYRFRPTAPWYPTYLWRPGDTWRGQHLLYIPAGLDTAEYQWQVLDEPVGTIRVNAPRRILDRPPTDIILDTTLGLATPAFRPLATLIGYTDTTSPTTACPIATPSHAAPPFSCRLQLVWRAEDETHTSYRVFLHLIGPTGNIVAQSDSIPADWTRPTTGWLPGEYILDPHTLDLPADLLPGEYTLYAGMYLPDGPRLTTSDGTDAVRLTTFTLETH